MHDAQTSGVGGALTLKGSTGMSGSLHDLVLLTLTLSKNNNFWFQQEKFVKKFKNFQLFSLNMAQILVHKSSKKFENFQSLKPLFHQKSVL